MKFFWEIFFSTKIFFNFFFKFFFFNKNCSTFFVLKIFCGKIILAVGKIILAGVCVYVMELCSICAIQVTITVSKCYRAMWSSGYRREVQQSWVGQGHISTDDEGPDNNITPAGRNQQASPLPNIDFLQSNFIGHTKPRCGCMHVTFEEHTQKNTARCILLWTKLAFYVILLLESPSIDIYFI